MLLEPVGATSAAGTPKPTFRGATVLVAPVGKIVTTTVTMPPTGAMMNLSKIVSELKSERARLDQTIAALEAVNSSVRRRGRPAGAPKRRRRRLSAAARRKLSRLLKQRWAAGKMKRKKKTA